MLARMPASSAAQGEFQGALGAALGPRNVLLCVALALLAWLPAVRASGWSFDDAEAIVGNPVVERSLPALAAFERDYWEHLSRAGHYRPIAVLSLRLDRWLYGDAVWGFHLTNVLLHAVVVGLAGVLLILLGAERKRGVGFGLALFAVHPALADSVAWISGRTSLLSALGGLSAAVWIALLAVPFRTLTVMRTLLAVGGACAGLAFALLSKEDALVFAPVLVAVALVHSRRMAWSSAAGCALALLIYGALRAQVYGSPLPSAPHAPLAAADWHERLLVGGRAALEALRIVAAPVGYPPNYERAPEFTNVSATLGVLGWCAWLALAASGAIALRRSSTTRPVAAFSALFAALAMLPWMQLVPAGVLFAPRLVYLPMLLALPLVEQLAARTFAGNARWIPRALLALAVAGAWQRSAVYSDRASYWRETARWVPRDARAHNELGLAAEEDNEPARAKEHWRRALELDPGYGRPWSNLGRLDFEAGDFAGAEQSFARATQLGPANPVAWINLGSARLRLQDWNGAASAYARACELAPGNASAWRGRARAELERGELGAAREAVARARELDPQDAAARELEQRIAARNAR